MFEKSIMVEFGENKIIVTFPDKFAHQYFKDECLKGIKLALTQLAGGEIEVVLKVDSARKITRDPSSDPKDQPRPEKPSFLTQRRKSPYDFEPIPGFTFEKFVIGESNRDALEAALALAKKQDGFKTVLVTGPIGTGKSHLLGGAYEYAGTVYPDLKILPCVLAKDFRGEFSRLAAEQNRLAWGPFNQKYFGSDMVFIDDIQRLAGAIKTMAQLKDIIDSVLFRNGAFIMLTSQPSLEDLESMFMNSVDKNAKDVLAKVRMVQELISRLWAFLTVEIKPPDFDLKVRVLLNKAREEPTPFNLDIEFAHEIAQKVTVPDMRPLVGIISSLRLRVSRGVQVDLALINTVCNELLGKAPLKKLDANAITEAVAKYHGISVPEVLSKKNRLGQVVRARHIAFYLCRRLLYNASTTDLGRYFGRDHSTIISGVEKIKAISDADPHLKKELEIIESKVLS